MRTTKIGVLVVMLICLSWTFFFLVGQIQADPIDPHQIELMRIKDDQITLLKWCLVGVCGAFSTVAGLLFNECRKSWGMINLQLKNAVPHVVRFIEILEKDHAYKPSDKTENNKKDESCHSPR